MVIHKGTSIAVSSTTVFTKIGSWPAGYSLLPPDRENRNDGAYLLGSVRNKHRYVWQPMAVVQTHWLIVTQGGTVTQQRYF